MTIVRDPVLRGVREVRALLFEEGTPPEDLLGRWETGCTLARLEDRALVLRLPGSVAIRCDVGRAQPLVDIAGRLVALPLDQPQVEESPVGSVIRYRHGRMTVHAPAQVADPLALLDLSGWHVEPSIPGEDQAGPADSARAAPPPPPPEPRLAIEPVDFDPRTSLGDRGDPTPRERRTWKRLQRNNAATGGPGVHGGAPEAAAPLLDWLYRRRHRKYLDELTRLFAAGDIDAALRLAIPLRGEGGTTASRGPKARKDLRITPRRPLSSSVVPVERGLQAELEHRYRAAFARLEGEGRVLDAAFVLADLLDRAGEACSFLERNGEVRLAAELAEARTNDHPEVVRLWWAVGERDRAMAIARRHGCFGPAVVRLERSGRNDEADALRRAWMAQLLDAGDIAGAYDVGATTGGEEAQVLRARLIELGVEQGGPLRARMLARQLRAGDGAPHPALDRLLNDPLAARQREVLAADVTADRKPVDHPQVVRALVRGLLGDAGASDPRTVEAAIDLTADPVFRADLPVRALVARRSRPAPAVAWIDVDATDRGRVQVRDARVLPDGRVILALDGVGIRVVHESGRTAFDMDVPANTLIPSDNGLRVLALRGLPGVVGVTAVALPERRSRPIGEFAATTWADTFDGAGWFLANFSQLWMVDMLADGPTALWRQSDEQEPIVGIARTPAQLSVAAVIPGAGAEGMQVLARVRRYVLPKLTVSGMRAYEVGGRFALTPDGDPVAGDAADDVHRARIEGSETGPLTIVVHRESVEAPVAVVRLAGATRAGVRLENGRLIVFDDCGRVEVVDLATGARQSIRAVI